MRTVYVGLCGRAGHGKSTLAKQLYKALGPERAVITAFADPIKEMLLVFGLDHDQLYGNRKGQPSLRLGGNTPRHAMQTLGTEWGRNMMYQDIWLDLWERRSMKLSRDVQVIIIEDVRFASEIRRLQALGAILVEVYRPDAMPKTWLGRLWQSLRRPLAHESERLDYSRMGVERIYNATTPEELLQAFFNSYPTMQVRTRL